MFVRVAETVLATARDDGVRGGDCVQERYATGCLGTVMPELQHIAFQIGVCLHDFFFAFDGEVSGEDGRVPESFEPKRDASFVRFDANIVSRVDCSHLEEVFFPQDSAMDVTDGDIPFAGFAENLLPIGFAFVHGTIACPKFLDGEHFQNRFGSAEMVLVGMRDDERIELAYTDVMQKRNDDLFAGILAAVVACVHKKIPAGWRLDEMAVALPDVNSRERPGRVQHFAVAFKREQSGCNLNA